MQNRFQHKNTVCLLICMAFFMLLGCSYTARVSPASPMTPSSVVPPSLLTVEEAIGILENPNSTGDALSDAALALAEYGPLAAPATGALTRVLQNADSSDARWTSASALGAIGQDAQMAVPVLLDKLNDPAGSVQDAASTALSQIIFVETAEEILPDLVDALDHPSETVRSGVIKSIGKMGAKASIAVPRLDRMLWEEEVLLVRGNAAYAIQVITGNSFSNIPDEPYWEGGFKLNVEENELDIVIAAKQWWLDVGNITQ